MVSANNHSIAAGFLHLLHLLLHQQAELGLSDLGPAGWNLEIVLFQHLQVDLLSEYYSFAIVHVDGQDSPRECIESVRPQERSQFIRVPGSNLLLEVWL